MNFLMNRRRFMKATSSAIVGGALSSVSSRARAASAGELRVNMSGGNYGEAIMEAFVKPFEAETGVKVTPIKQDISPVQVEMMVTTNNVAADVVILNQLSTLELAAHGSLEEIDYSIYRQQELDAIARYCKQSFGLGPYVYSMNMVYNTNKFPSDRPRPTTWAEFWDVDKFPGVRALYSGEGGPGPWEEALLADGVPMDKLYPMDIDRVFASLDRIKPHIRKWWVNGAEVLQIMRDDVADLVQAFDGRALSLIDAGEPIQINRNQAKLNWDYWIIPKGSPNARNAQKFIELTSRADRQAAFAKLFALAPSNQKAYGLMADNLARKLATHPDYIATSYYQNAKWYAETGLDGLSNKERLVQRWNQWILQ